MATGESREASGMLVRADADHNGMRRRVFGRLPMDVKVAGQEAQGGLMVLEQVDDLRGGPPRHVHPAQDEWFYVIAGHYVMEVGEERFELGPGDFLWAPRGVPHVWAHAGEGVGRMLVGFQPAGDMEAFFDQATALAGLPSGPEVAALFAAHGMRLLGPPLDIE